MQITILGTRGMIPKSAPQHRKHSGVLIDGVLLFDVGEREFLSSKLQAIFITHLHPDHAVFVQEPLTLPQIAVYAPEQKEFPFITVATPVSVGTYRVTPLATEHSAKVASCAYLIEQGGKRILYTGDIVWMQKKQQKKLGKLDCVITEGSFIKEGGMIRKDPKTGRLYGHTGIPNLIRLFGAHTDTIILTHFGSWFFADIEASKHALAALGEKYGVTLVVAHDNLTITV